MRIPITRLCRYNGAIGTLAIGLLGLSPGALALNLGFGDWQAHGFLSQGYTYTSGNDFFGNSQGNGSLDFTELGLNVLGPPLAQSPHRRPGRLPQCRGLGPAGRPLFIGHAGYEWQEGRMRLLFSAVNLDRDFNLPPRTCLRATSRPSPTLCLPS